MRIISGQSGGIPISVPKTVLRPTADRVREAVFSILGPRVVGAAVLDAFAGSGSYGLECLSRGAASVVFVEENPAACETIRQNLAKARLGGGSVVTARLDSYLTKNLGAAFDLIFADPPYKKSPRDRDWDAELLASSALASALRPGGLFVLESFSRGATSPLAHSPWRLTGERRYGDALLRFLETTENA
jgi:16S rRNA (guanine966-N2)-methyltransferase